MVVTGSGTASVLVYQAARTLRSNDRESLAGGFLRRRGLPGVGGGVVSRWTIGKGVCGSTVSIA